MRYQEIEVEYIRETEKAVLLNVLDEDSDIWFPFSTIEDISILKSGFIGMVNISEWFLEKEGLL